MYDCETTSHIIETVNLTHQHSANNVIKNQFADQIKLCEISSKILAHEGEEGQRCTFLAQNPHLNIRLKLVEISSVDW